MTSSGIGSGGQASGSSIVTSANASATQTRARGELELTFADDLLRHIGRLTDHCEERLLALERERAAVTQRPASSRAERAEHLRTEAAGLRVELKRLQVATTLLHCYVQLRRRHLGQLSAPVESNRRRMEVL